MRQWCYDEQLMHTGLPGGAPVHSVAVGEAGEMAIPSFTCALMQNNRAVTAV